MPTIKLVDGNWTPKVNLYHLECGRCGLKFMQPATLWWATCPRCHATDHITVLRDAYAKLAAPAPKEAL